MFDFLWTVILSMFVLMFFFALGQIMWQEDPVGLTICVLLGVFFAWINGEFD